MTGYSNLRFIRFILRTVFKIKNLKFKVTFSIKRAKQIFTALNISVDLSLSNCLINMIRCIPLLLTDRVFILKKTSGLVIFAILVGKSNIKLN